MGIFATFKSIVVKEGVKSLYAGLFATYIKLMPSSALAFAINEKLKDSFNIH
jgi:hypothetical protein